MAEIQRLRRKFILVGTLAVIIIVVGALGLINTISYMRMQHSVFRSSQVSPKMEGSCRGGKENGPLPGLRIRTGTMIPRNRSIRSVILVLFSTASAM
ncbi:hypothetical protein M5E89_08385 [Acidaminococcus intestini]|nr:hypothetical protein M5E89_08385 [Acidaminococcus intestini]